MRFECEVRVPILREKSCERGQGADRGGRGAVIFLRLWGEGVRLLLVYHGSLSFA